MNPGLPGLFIPVGRCCSAPPGCLSAVGGRRLYWPAVIRAQGLEDPRKVNTGPVLCLSIPGEVVHNMCVSV